MEYSANNQFSENYTKINLPNSTAVLVLGIISIVSCFCYGVPGVVCGIIALVLAKKSGEEYFMNPDVYSLSSLNNLKAGKVCGIIGLILSGLYIILMIVYIIFYGTVMTLQSAGSF